MIGKHVQTLILVCRDILLIYAYLWIDERFEKYLSCRINMGSILKMIISQKTYNLFIIHIGYKIEFPTKKNQAGMRHIHNMYQYVNLCNISIFSYRAYWLRLLTKVYDSN